MPHGETIRSRRPLPFEGVAQKAATWAETPFGKMFAAMFAWGFRGIVLGAIAIGGYAGSAWLDAKIDDRLSASPPLIDTAKRVGVIEPLVATNARSVDRISTEQRQLAEMITTLNGTLLNIDRNTTAVNTNVAVLTSQVADLKATLKDTADRLDRRMDALSRRPISTP